MTRPLVPGWRRPLAAAVAGALLLLGGCSGGDGGDEKEVLGPRIKGTSSSSEAPVLQTGDSWDNLGATNTDDGVRSYSIERETDKESVQITVNTLIANGSEDGITVELKTPTGHSCGTDSEESSSYSKALLLSTAAVSDSDDEECLNSKRLIATVKRNSKTSSGWLDLRLRLSRSAHVDPESFPDPPESTDNEPLAFGATVAKAGGTWISDAVDVSGQTINSEVANGAITTYKTAIKWGEGLKVHVNFPDVPPSIMPDVEKNKVRGFMILLGPGGSQQKSEDVDLTSPRSIPVNLPIASIKKRSDGAALQGTYTIVIGVRSETPADVKIPFSLVSKPYGEANAALGPETPLEVVTKPSKPQPLLWGLLVTGILLTLAGVTQVLLHRRHG